MEKMYFSISKETQEFLEKKVLDKKNDENFNKLVKNLKLTNEEIQRNITSIEDTLCELENCKKCPGLARCKNHLKGYVYYPQKLESKIAFNYIPCRQQKKLEEDLANKDATKVLENAKMKDIDSTDENRYELIKWVTKFYKDYDVAKNNKGLYLHGSFGSGKTFIIAALFNELKDKKNASYEIIYFPEMLRNLKDNFNLLEAKLRYYSNVELLLIDDIGAEKVSDWGRDEVLGTILQHRMNNHLTTFFTSNLTMKELEKHLSLTKDSQDTVKARRIIERIKQLTTDLELISINRRN